MNRRRIPFGLLEKNPLSSAVLDFLEQAGLDYERRDGGFLLHADEDEPLLDCHISCSEDGLLQVCALYSEPFSKQSWISLILCLNRLNFQIGAGRFTLDPDSGRLGFKVSLMVNKQQISMEMVKQHFDLCLRQAALAQPLFVKLGNRQMTAAEATDSILKRLGAYPQASKPPHSWN